MQYETIPREEQEEIIDHCLNGRMDRDCQNCPAHHGYGGICCYGIRHEYDDECGACRHRTTCSKLTHSRNQTTRSNRVSVNRGPTKNVKGLVPVAVQRSQAKGSDGILQQPEVMKKPATKKAADQATESEEPFMKQLGRHTAWGMVEGGLEMALRFFRIRRPE